MDKILQEVVLEGLTNAATMVAPDDAPKVTAFATDLVRLFAEKPDLEPHELFLHMDTDGMHRMSDVVVRLSSIVAVEHSSVWARARKKLSNMAKFVKRG